MKRHDIQTIFILLICCCLLSCKKYLEEKPNTGLVVPTTVGDLQALLDDHGGMNQTRTPATGEVSSDDYFLPDANFATRSQNDQDIYKWVPNDKYPFPNDWSYANTPIFTANYCLEQLEKTSPTASNAAAWNNVKGSALLFRAFYRAQLATVYCKAYDANTAATDLGLPLRSTSDFNVPSSRASLKETYEAIIADTKASLTLLPQKPAHSYRPSQWGASGLLARVYLSMRQYDSAFKYANSYLSIKSDLMDFKGDPEVLTLTGNRPFVSFNKEIAFYTEMCPSNPITRTLSRIDTVLYLSYAANDLRQAVFYGASSGYRVFKGSYAEVVTVNFTGIATDEMLLIRAECNARSQNTAQALSDLNALLVKRYNNTFTPLTASTANDALTLVLRERRKELIRRGIRFSDIKRLNKESGREITLTRKINGNLISLPPNDPRYALQIPYDIIQLSGMPQNP